MNNTCVMRLLTPLVIGVLAISCSAQAQSTDQTTTKPAVPVTTPDTSRIVADSIHWVSFEQGMKSSQETGKPVFLFCYGSWCGYCQKMITRTFVDSTVINYLNSFFTAVKIETKSTRQTVFNDTAMSEAQVANKEFGVTAVPCMWLLEPNGCRIKKIKGYCSAAYLLTELQAVHGHTYGECKNVPITDSPPPSEPAGNPLKLYKDST
jgi:thioredoxin-related protein